MFDAKNWKGKSAGTPLSKFDPEQLKMGMKEEMEHTDEPGVAVRIAADHLMENPVYYTKLKTAGLMDEGKLRSILIKIIKEELSR